MKNIVKKLVTELPKSSLPASFANEGDGYTFFVSGPKPLECDKYIVDGEAIILSTGGNAAVHYGNGKFSYSTDCWALQPVENDIIGKYLYYFLYSQLTQIEALGFEGSGLKHLRKDFIRNYEVPILSKPEQSKIAEVLSKVDQAIEQTESLIAKQQRIKTGLMQDLLTRGIDEHGNIRSEETHQFKDSPLGRIPVEWEVKKLSELSTHITKGESPGWQGFKYQSDGILFVTSENVRDGYLDLVNYRKYISADFNRKIKRSELKTRDVLVNLVGASIARVAVFNEKDIANINQAVCLIRLTCLVEPIWLAGYLQLQENTSRLLGEQVETARANLSLDDIRNFSITLPTIIEQSKTAEILSKYDMQIRTHLDSLTKLLSLKTALMQDLLTGKVRVTPLMDNTEADS